MVLQLQRDGQTWKGHLQINYSVKDFASESFDLTDLRIGDRDFTFSDPSSAGVNKFKVLFRGVKSGAELRGVAETKVEGKVGTSDYRLEVLGDWVLRREIKADHASCGVRRYLHERNGNVSTTFRRSF